jgi:O-antigen/teichoic acid export membrane protein
LNNKINGMTYIKRIAFAIITQGLLGLLSIITGFVMPKYMGPLEYGYWQIYFFYVGYINFLGLGYNDGIVLNYAGYDLRDLPYERIRSAIRIILGYIGVITVILAAFVLLFSGNASKIINLVLVTNILPTIIFCIILALYLATNHSVLYNLANLMLRLLSCLIFIIFLIRGITSYEPMILADTLSKYIITIILCFMGYRFFVGKSTELKEGLTEIKQMAGSGIKVMLSVILSGLIPMVGRMVIEWNEPIEVYGVYSFAITLLSIILTFTNTVGIIIFPMIKRLSSDKLSDYYIKFNYIFEAFVMIAFLLYIPLVIIIQSFMKDYIAALEYLPILIALCFPIGKIQLLLFPYYKAHRQENKLLLSNVMGFISMVLGTFAVYFLTHSVFAVALTTTIVMIIYYKLSELYLCKKTGIKAKMNSWIEIILIIMFIIIAKSFDLLLFGIIYGIILLAYLIINRKKLLLTLRSFKNINNHGEYNV